MATVLITGGNGLIGKYLAHLLVNCGFRVHVLSRSKIVSDVVNYFQWDPPNMYIENGAIAGVEYIIHLAGENISGGRWSPSFKKKIIESRVQPAALLLEHIQKQDVSLKAFISASGVGYYSSDFTEKVFTESDSPGTGFLSETCQLWESAADNFRKLDIRTVKIRTGVVLSNNGGALKKLLLPVKNGLGAALGSGKQILPWIHINDLCAIYLKAIEDSQMQGVYNAVAPEYTTNKEFTETLAKFLKKPVWLPNIPSFVLKMALGEMSQILLTGNRISPQKIINQGYGFQYPRLPEALAHLLR